MFFHFNFTYYYLYLLNFWALFHFNFLNLFISFHITLINWLILLILISNNANSPLIILHSFSFLNHFSQDIWSSSVTLNLLFKQPDLFHQSIKLCNFCINFLLLHFSFLFFINYLLVCSSSLSTDFKQIDTRSIIF